MQTGLHRSIHAFEPTSWDALNPGRYPGLLHGFLSLSRGLKKRW